MTMLIGLPSTLPPKSSIAICAAVTEPWPVGVDAGPFMSVRTPILTTLSDTCASAAGEASVAAVSAPNMDRLRTNIPRFSLCIGTLAAGVVFWAGGGLANWSHLQLNWAAVNRAKGGAEPLEVSGSVYFRLDSGHSR